MMVRDFTSMAGEGAGLWDDKVNETFPLKWVAMELVNSLSGVVASAKMMLQRKVKFFIWVLIKYTDVSTFILLFSLDA